MAIRVPRRSPVRPVDKINSKKFASDGLRTMDRTPVTPETRDAIRAAAVTSKAQVCQSTPFRPDGLETARQLWWQFFGGAGGMLLGPMLEGHEPDISPVLKEFSWLGCAGAASHGRQLCWPPGWAAIRCDAKILAEMKAFPILLCPVAAIPAFHHREREWIVEGKKVKYLDAWSYTEWFNLLGFPAAVVPIGFSAQGLPIGVQIVGRPWEEELVLAVARVSKNNAARFRRPRSLETQFFPAWIVAWNFQEVCGRDFDESCRVRLPRRSAVSSATAAFDIANNFINSFRSFVFFRFRCFSVLIFLSF